MANTQTDTKRQNEVPQKHVTGLSVFGWISPTISVLLLLITSLAFSIAAEWVGLWFFWEEDGITHSENMLAREISFIHDDFRRKIILSSPAESVSNASEHIYRWLVVSSGLLALHKNLMSPISPVESSFRSTAKMIWHASATHIFAAVNITRLFFVRLAVIAWTLPVFFLVALVAFVDGLVQRDLRTFGGDREHWLIHRLIKPYIKPMFFLAAFIYLAIPVSIHPNWVFLPAAGVGGVFIYIATSTFMKHV